MTLLKSFRAAPGGQDAKYPDGADSNKFALDNGSICCTAKANSGFSTYS